MLISKIINDNYHSEPWLFTSKNWSLLAINTSVAGWSAGHPRARHCVLVVDLQGHVVVVLRQRRLRTRGTNYIQYYLKLIILKERGSIPNYIDNGKGSRQYLMQEYLIIVIMNKLSFIIIICWQGHCIWRV